MKTPLLLSMPSGEEWLGLIGIALLFMFFVFKAGQWYGQSKTKQK